MKVTAKLKHLRIAPRKARLVVDLVRGKSVEQAQRILNFTVKKSASPVLKLLKSAIANAKNNFQLQESNLYIEKIIVDEGPKLKRWRPRARGQAYPIEKKTSHITLILEEITKSPERKAAKKEGKEKRITEPSETAEAKKERISAAGKTKFKPVSEIQRPKTGKGLNKMFRRKSV